MSRSKEDLLRFRRDSLQFSLSDGEAPPVILRVCCGGSEGDGINFADGNESFGFGRIIVYLVIGLCVCLVEEER